MGRLLLIFLLWGFSCADSLRGETLYRLYMKDKQGSVEYALSERALQRRAKQGIDLDETDLKISAAYLSDLRLRGYEVRCSSRWLNTVVIGEAAGKTISEEELSEIPYVVRYEKVASDVAKNAALRVSKLLENEQSSGFEENFRAPVYEVKGESLLNAGYLGQGVLVAVIDGGFKAADMLASADGKIVGAYDAYRPDDSNALYQTTSDHGTSCLSIMCSDEQYGIWGTAPQAQYLLIRTEEAGVEYPFEEDAWVYGAELADSLGADVISSSLGYTAFDDASFSHVHEHLTDLECFISRGADQATRKGMVVCSSAGNEGNKAWKDISYPANVARVLSVGATDETLSVAQFSAHGWTDPYVKPDMCCRGQQSYVYDTKTGGVNRKNGTSFSCPLIAGLCASLWSAVPGLTAEQLVDVVRRSCDRYKMPDSLLGYGMPDFEEALHLAQLINTGVEAISENHSDREASYYDLQGRKVDKSCKNSFCIQQNAGKIIILKE